MTAIRSPENALLICERLAEGHTLREIARELGCTAGAICIWAADDERFAKQYARAMEARMDQMAAEIEEIADDGSNDWMEREGHTVLNGEHVQRSRLRIDTRKWLMSKMVPKKYGDRVTHAGDPNNPIATIDLTPAEKRERALRHLAEVFGEPEVPANLH